MNSKIEKEIYNLKGNLQIRQAIGNGCLQIYLENEASELLDSYSLSVYGGPSTIEPILVSPDLGKFAVFSTGNTGFEETITYCAILKVSKNHLIKLYEDERVGGSKYRYDYKAKVLFSDTGNFDVQW